MPSKEQIEQQHADDAIDARLTGADESTWCIITLKRALRDFIASEFRNGAHPDRGLYTESKGLLEELMKRGNR